MPFALFLALKYLKPKRSITSVVTVLSVLGVVLGVSTVIIVRAVFTGFGDLWREKILAFKPHITIQSQQGYIEHENDLCRRIETIPGVVAASASIETRVLAEYHRRILAPIVIGVDPARADRMLQTPHLVDGKFDLSGDNILIGIDMARNLGVMVGDRILLHSPMNLIHTNEIRFPEELVISGIYEAGQRDFDSDFVIASLDVARDLLGMKQGALSIHVKTAQPMNAKVFDPCLAAIRDEIGWKYTARTWQSVDRELFSALAVEKNMTAILVGIITLVAIFCVTVTLIVIAEQKTN